MLETLALLLVHAGGPPQGAPMTSLFRADDYPIGALRNGEQGTVFYEQRVGTDGSPKACRVTPSSGSVRLDTATCSILMARARFHPARDNYGRPVEDVFKGQINWRTEG